MKFPLRSKVFLLGLLLTVGAVWAHGGATGVVKERMDAMEVIAENVKRVGNLLKTGDDIDRQLVVEAADVLFSHAGKALTDQFPEGSLMPPSEASPDIWQNWQRFSDLASDLQGAAAEMKTAAEAGGDRQSVVEAFRKIGQTCKACHQDFRVKK